MEMELFFLIFLALLMNNFFLSHPLTFSLNLILMAICGSLLLLTVNSLWMMYVVLLAFLGGVMVLFIYVSILSNDSKLVLKPPMNLSILLLLMIIFTFPMSKPYTAGFVNFFFIFQKMSVFNLFFIIFYLLVTLFLVVKMSESFKGSLLKTK